jgi:hypothetical protein
MSAKGAKKEESEGGRKGKQTGKSSFESFDSSKKLRICAVVMICDHQGHVLQPTEERVGKKGRESSRERTIFSRRNNPTPSQHLPRPPLPLNLLNSPQRLFPSPRTGESKTQVDEVEEGVETGKFGERDAGVLESGESAGEEGWEGELWERREFSWKEGRKGRKGEEGDARRPRPYSTLAPCVSHQPAPPLQPLSTALLLEHPFLVVLLESRRRRGGGQERRCEGPVRGEKTR